jgi:hypothetical protein
MFLFAIHERTTQAAWKTFQQNHNLTKFIRVEIRLQGPDVRDR